MDVLTLIILWIALSVVVGFWNVARGNSFATGVLLSLLLSPVIGAIIVAFTKAKKKRVDRRKMESAGKKNQSR